MLRYINRFNRAAIFPSLVLCYIENVVVCYMFTVIHIQYSTSKVNKFIFVSLTSSSLSIIYSNVLIRFKCYDNFKLEILK
jgi:hypothetical protein